MIDYMALKSEIINDPNMLGLSGLTDIEIANKLNNETINKDVQKNTEVTISEVIKAISPVDLNALTVKQIAILQILLTQQKIDMQDINILDFFKSIFSASTTSRNNLAKLVDKRISRSKKLFGRKIHYWDVARASAL